MTRTAIIAAMPGELKPLVRNWRHELSNGVHLWRHTSGNNECIAACAGAGQPAATRAFAAIEKSGPVDQVISTGWAGALSDEFLPGRAYRVSGAIDAATGERFLIHDWPGEPWLVTSPKVADPTEKRRLQSTYAAGLVDMEAAAIARLAHMRGIPFYCIKGISDGFRDELPDFNRFISDGGQFLMARLVLFAILRPWYWPVLARMGENSSKAAKNLAESLLELLPK